MIQDRNSSFPLYQAPLETGDGQCTICHAENATCPAVDYLIAPCPSCDQDRTWEVEAANEISRCPWCDRQANWPSDWPWDYEEIAVCVDCLRVGRGAISHATELGFLSPPLAMKGMLDGGSDASKKAQQLGFETTVLETFSDGSETIGVHLPQAQLDELMRTPRHPTLQEEHWTYHCGGWMTYLGKWQTQDFERQAPGRAREWFAQHFGRPDDSEMYWDWVGDDTAWSCVFGCPRCGAHKVFCDIT